MNQDNFEFHKSNSVKRVLLLVLLGVVIVWGVSEKKILLRLTPASYKNEQSSPKQIEVHPEVLNLQESFSRVAESVKPAVVNISTVHLEKYVSNPYEFFFMDPEDLFEHFFDAPSQPRQRREPQQKYHERKIPGTGSGVIIDPEGYILTNEHVVRSADEIKVTLADNPDKKLDGKVIGRDERTDLAVVKIKSSKPLPYAQLGDSDHVRVGDWAIAIGSPFGLEQTVTVGVISASRQNLAIENRTYKDLIQTDAAINPGNSGGPLVNIHGEIIGINTAIYTPSGGFAGIGFAIPINRAKEIIPQLREKGKVIRGWIGVVLEEKIDEATANVFGVPDREGSLIREVLQNYPAAKAGLKRGDIIREFDDKKVKNNYDLQTIVSATPPNKKVAVKVIRNKKEMTLFLTIAEAPASMDQIQKGTDKPSSPQVEGKEAKWMGATVTDLNPTLSEQFSIPSSESGVVVIHIEEGSKSEEMGLQPGDLVRSINQENVSDVKTFKELVKKVKTQNGVVLDMFRKGNSFYLSYMGAEK